VDEVKLAKDRCTSSTCWFVLATMLVCGVNLRCPGAYLRLENFHGLSISRTCRRRPCFLVRSSDDAVRELRATRARVGAALNAKEDELKASVKEPG
jgi:hypothetical protein